MSRLSDQECLLKQQYRDGSNLNVRAQLHERFSTNRYGWHRWVFDRISIPCQSDILELGCGPGLLWLNNEDRVPGTWKITLSDFSPGMLAEAQQNLRNRRFTFKIIDAQSIPFEDRTFDTVIANHMLYHVPDRGQALSEIHRVLKPEGRFYAATNGRDHMRELGDLVHRFDPDFVRDSRGADAFGLENGREQLVRYFTDVTLHIYEDALSITEAEPLVAYVLSTKRSALAAEKWEAFTRLVETQIASSGAIHITKAMGLFVAQK